MFNFKKKDSKSPSPTKENEKHKNLFSIFAKPFDEVIAKPFHEAADAVQAAGSNIAGIGHPGSKSSGVQIENSSGGTSEAATTTNEPDTLKSPTVPDGSSKGTPPTKPKAPSNNLFAKGSQTIKKGVKKLTAPISPRRKVPQIQPDDVGTQLEPTENEGDLSAGATAAVEPDMQLPNMNLIINKTLKGVSVRDWYETCWSEGLGTVKEPFYGPWLEGTGKSNVVVQDWTFATESSPIVGLWDKESYDQTRQVTFVMPRGAMTTNVTHSQYCRLEANDNKCVVTTMVKMKGIPFSDSFYVVIRWVGTTSCEKPNHLEIKVGLFVVFVKSVLVAGKIKSGTTEQTTQTQLELFRQMKNTCVPTEAGAGGESEEEIIDTSEEALAPSRELVLGNKDDISPIELLIKKIQGMVALCFPFTAKSESEPNSDYGDDIERVKNEIKVNLRVVRNLPSNTNVSSGDGDDLKYILEECDTAQEALDKCVLKFVEAKHSRKGPECAPPEDEDDQARSASRSGPEKFFRTMMSPLHKIVELGESSVKQTSSALKGTFLSSPSPRAPNEAREMDGEDKVLQSMNVVIDRLIPNASVADIYDNCVAEKNGPFFKSWLESIGATGIGIETWTNAVGGESFADEWSGETYTKRRKITYTIKRKTVVGHEVIPCEVTLVQHCRRENAKKLVLQGSLETSGLPFGDTHTDMIRHVYTQADNGAVHAKCGVFILLLKETMLSSKVRVEASREATKRQLELFRSLCAAVGGGRNDESVVERVVDVQREVERMQPIHCISLRLQACLIKTQRLTHMYPDGLLEDVESVNEQLNLIATKIRAIEPFLESRPRGDEEGSDESWSFILNELETVNEALDNIITWHGDQTKGKEALERASFE